MLNVNPDTVCRLIELARSFHVKEEIVIPEEPKGPDDDWHVQILADHPQDPVFKEFRSIIQDLEPDQQQEVVALLWVGRGDFEPEEWDAVLSEAAYAWNTKTAEYLIAHPMLADYLTDALEMYDYRCD